VTLTTGNRTLAQIIAEINAAILAAGLEDDIIAETSTGVFSGRLVLRALKSDGITRTGVGQYYVDYMVPEDFVNNGVLWKKYLDVWKYFPDNTYDIALCDDTAYFVVYPNKFFLDTGYNNYDFSFNLTRDLFYKDEVRFVVCDIQALPKYRTPTVNDWILPISNSRYKIVTDENLEIVPFTQVELATGRELKFTLDTRTTSFRDGVYKIIYEIDLPNGEIIRSPSLKFRLTAK